MTLPATPINTPVIPYSTTIYYCDPGDIQRRLSTESIKLKIEDYGKSATAGESGSIDDAIWDATEIINFYCFVHYQPGDLAKSLWVNRRATDLAVYILAKRRGNVPTSSMTESYKQSLDWLEKVHLGTYEIPNVPFRHTLAPSFSNLRVDFRYSTYRLRVERTISDKSPAPYGQQIDLVAEYDFSI